MCIKSNTGKRKQFVEVHFMGFPEIKVAPWQNMMLAQVNL